MYISNRTFALYMNKYKARKTVQTSEYDVYEIMHKVYKTTIMKYQATFRFGLGGERRWGMQVTAWRNGFTLRIFLRWKSLRFEFETY